MRVAIIRVLLVVAGAALLLGGCVGACTVLVFA